MASQSLSHDAARVIAASILEVFEPLLRDEEKRDAFAEVYERAKAGIESYDILKNRQEMRLKPSLN